MGDGGNGRQGFPTESHGGKRKKIIGIAYLRGSVPLECHPEVGGRHPLAVINDLDEGTTGIHHTEYDTGGARIERVLHQFLYYRGRALYDLTRGNLVGDGIGK
ncbi:hypothetical protein SDC9_203964 [bioreactor metagenome]|uniref:Uncharacterized protein n=1 Tax=bioreactor metagenome TaxID=1076179 RepID=A0A645IXY9_9ZZZZ